MRVLLDHQVARVDEDGAYAELPGDASVAAFKVARNEDGEWRITSAADPCDQIHVNSPFVQHLLADCMTRAAGRLNGRKMPRFQSSAPRRV